MNDQATAVDPEDQLAAIFEKQEKAEADPVEEDVGVEEAETTDDESPEAAEEGQAEEDDGEEIEVEGKAYKVDKTLAAKLKAAESMQRDYTQKTQEAASIRKAAEERIQAAEAMERMRQASFTKAAEAFGIQQRLEAYDALDWNALFQTDPNTASAHKHERDTLREKLQRLNHESNQAWQAAEQQRQAALHADRQRTFQEVRKAIPNYDQALDDKLGKFVAEVGAPAETFASSPALVQLAYEAMKWRELQASKPALNKRVEGKPPVKVVAARSAQTNQQAAGIEQAKARVKKTGSSADAEDFLTRLFERKRKR